jgi:pimeloyl-ACP methyl ester carboxylesterase
MMKRFMLSLIVLLSAATVSAQEAASFEERECWFALPLGISVTCGYVTVPESRDPDLADDTNEIRVAVAVVHSGRNTPLPDPVIYLDGGPGAHSLAFGNFYIQDMARFVRDRDLILFDQRGVGYSEPRLHCPELLAISYEYLDEDLSYEESQTIWDNSYLTCRDQLIADGANLNRYNSAENAADVRDIVTALGYDQVNLFGASYGTRLALTVMRDHPDRVRSAVLDSVYPPNADSQSDFLPNLSRAFDRLFETCAQNTVCSENFPDLESVFYRTVDRLNETPELITVTDRYAGGERQVLMDGDVLIASLFSLLYQTRSFPYLPRYIYEADQGVYDGFVDEVLFDLYYGQFFDGPVYYAVECYEEVPFSTVEDIRASLDGLPPQLVSFFTADDEATLDDNAEFCASWASGQQADPIENEAVTSDVPTLLLAGEFDPITPLSWALLAAETLPNSHVYEFPGVGHGVYFSATCGERMIVRFIDDPDAEPNASCIETMPPIIFRSLDD